MLKGHDTARGMNGMNESEWRIKNIFIRVKNGVTILLSNLSARNLNLMISQSGLI
jgi:hypothetical protein